MKALQNLTIYSSNDIRSDENDYTTYVNAYAAGEIINDLLHEIWILRNSTDFPGEKERLTKLVQDSMPDIERLRR
jgi:hypothetical protein